MKKVAPIPRDCLCFWDDPNYVEDVMKDPIGYPMLWVYFDKNGNWHGGRCVNERQAKQLATRYGYRQRGWGWSVFDNPDKPFYKATPAVA